MAKSRAVVALILLISTASILKPNSATDLGLSPGLWDFGTIERGETAAGALHAENNGTSAMRVTLTPACGCLRADPPRMDLPPGSSGTFRLFFDSKDDLGKVSKAYIVGSGDGDGPAGSRLYSVEGTVVEPTLLTAGGPETGQDPGDSAAGSANGRSAEISYYYAPGCRSCERFLKEELPALAKELGVRVDVKKKDALDPLVFRELEQRLEELGGVFSAFPVLIVADTVIQGDAEIGARLPAILLAQSMEDRPASPGSRANGAPGRAVGEGFAALPVLIGGLLDGVNPCAFTTLIFLLASLALAGRGRRDVLVIGLLFSLSVFVTYLAVGLGFFTALRAAAGYAAVSLVLRWILFAVLLVFAGLSIYDFFKIRAGKPAEIVLQLPLGLKQRIHAAIRSRVRTAAIAGSSLVLGFLVSIFEFACTGQVYLPTLAYLVRIRENTRALPLLLLYNLGFIAPLLAVFAAAYLGVGSKAITRFFQNHMAAVKVGLAVFFLGLAAFTLAG
jgi:cytochrome c biogenesis protein CcdA